MAKRKTSTNTSTRTPTKKVSSHTHTAPTEEVAVAAPQNAPTPKNSATISRKEMLREAAARKRQEQSRWLMAAGVVIVLLIGVAVYIGYRNSLPVVGETTFPTQGNLHIPLGSTTSTPYNSTPPSSGPHYENLAAWGIQTQNVRYEHLIHNLEDAGVVIYYQCDDGCPELVAELEAVVEPLLAADRHVVLARNDPTWVENGQALHQDMGARIAVVAWRKLLLMNEVNADTIRTFIERYEGIDHHRG
jgi:hypothetical protein